MRHKDGHRIPVRVRVIPTYDSSGARSGAAELFRLNSPAEQLERRLADLERLALLDPLTALPNRRYLEAQLANRLDELCRYSWPFGLAFLDVDQFKRVNDVHGHQVGDEVLRMVGKTLSAGTRTFDAVGRWAGDEFLAVLANVQQRELEEVAERFRALVSSAGLGAGVGIQVTVSIGVTLASREDSIETLVQRADRLMYEAKRAGRNRVCV
jgi:diguanylate cyclase (GGDEF)-like protein